MNTQNRSSYPVVEQLTNNATSWLGHRKSDHKEIIMGQTFVAPAEGDLDTIEVYACIVANPGDVAMSVHRFDTEHQTWGPALGSAHVNFNQSCTGKWVAFQIPGLHLSKGLTYGFLLESHDSYVGVGEAAGSAKNPPYASGKEWTFIDRNKSHAYSYFSLAFKVGLKAA
jgi:hypothetical protein